MKIKPIGVNMGASEASGVTRRGDELIVVSDAAPGAYFTINVSGASGPLIRLAPDKVARCDLPGASLAVDFEGIDVLADGRVVALSERLRSLIGANGVVVQYDDPLSEFGERGLEGVAVRPSGDGSSEIAVLWEGGWVEDSEVQARFRPWLTEPLRPAILVHQLSRNDAAMKVVIEKDADLIELDVPEPDHDAAGWRFRAPDLVWHEWRDERGNTVTGFIVLLNSQTPRKVSGKSKYGPRWLQRFDRDGHSVGKPIDIDAEARRILGKDDVTDANWEGLGWYEHGRSVVLVHDEPNLVDGTPVALVLELPTDWLV
jgi:hypothetical protein